MKLPGLFKRDTSVETTILDGIKATLQEKESTSIIPEKQINRTSYAVTSVFFSLFIFFLVVTAVYVTSLATSDEALSTTQSAQLEKRWSISKITPSSEQSLFDITVTSNQGHIREYSNLISFGLSKDGQLLTTNSQKGLEMITLENNSKKTITPPVEQFAGDSGDFISWSSDSQYFAFSVIKNQNAENTSILIFKNDGSFYKEIEANIATRSGTFKALIEPVFFDRNNTLLLTRTYKDLDAEDTKEDGTKYMQTDLPIYLTIYNIEGNIIRDLNVRDFDTSGTTVYYRWDRSGDRYIDYQIIKSNEEIDFSKTYLFTKVAI